MASPTAQVKATQHPTFPSVGGGMMRVSILTELPALLREMGQDPDQLLCELGLDPALLVDPENTLPFWATGNVLSHCVMRTGCSHFGLLLGQRGGTSTLGIVGLLVRSSPDVGSALRNLVKHLHHHDQGAVPNLSVKGNTALLSYAIYEKGVHAADQVYAAAMSVAFRIMRDVCGSGWRPSKVLLPFRRPRDPVPLRQFFRAPLRFDAEQAGLVFPAAWLNRPLHCADHKTRRQVETLLEAHTHAEFVIRARRAVRLMLAHGQASEEHLAHHFGVSRRTLIRQLQQEGTSFRILLKEIRLEVACQMLRDTDNSIDHIATSLGYAGASPFTRAFKTWIGQTPAGWRNCNAAGPVGR